VATHFGYYGRENSHFDGKASDTAGWVAVGRVSVAGDWAAITAVEVAPAFRRRGLGVAITSALCSAAARRGAPRVLLQVEADNIPAQALYARCAFRPAHRYHYRLAPSAVPLSA
jgi:ribosomal protein S18 acetylase RimI-like enzyme